MPKRFFSVVKSLIQEKIQAFNPLHFEVIDESWMHKVGNETHFNILIVSDKFVGVDVFKREYLIFKELSEIWANGVRTVSIVAKTSKEYEEYISNAFIYEYPSEKS